MFRFGMTPFLPHLLAAVLLAISSRIALLFGSMVVPIPNEAGLPISPLTANTALDLGYYQMAREMYFRSPHLIIDHYERYFTGKDTGHFFLPGPLYPGILELFDYGPANTLPLSTLFLLASSGLAAAWLWWLHRNGVNPIWLYVFAILPTPFWFMLNVSTDLLFAVVVGAFCFLWLDRRSPSSWHMASVAGVVILAGLLRPNTLSLLVFLIADVLIWMVALKEQRQARLRVFVFAIVITIMMISFMLIYMPYFHWVLTQSGGSGYFGRLPAQYLEGLWSDLPVALNLALSWVSLIAAKVLYLTGLRPSFGDTATPLVILRMLPGVVMLPGLIWLLFWTDWRTRLFIFFFLAPILLGVSQDRYVLPIQPVLFFYGTKAWRDIALILKKAQFWQGQK